MLELLKNGYVIWINYPNLDNYLHKLFGILLHGIFVISLPLFSRCIYLFILVCAHGYLFYMLGL